MSGNEVFISVKGVSKKFSRSLKRSFIYGARDIGRNILGRGGEEHLRPSEFWAIRDVSLELRKGESIGIIGLNGSGKTTLLRMISGILAPTLGDIQVYGRIAPMLALGAGFKPVLSGRENIFLNLALLGVAERDIHARFDSIVDFAELHESINAPLGTYSSGMRGRLGFACAVHTNPQILVVDEVLSVGDTRFRMKCRNKINELRRDGTSLLLVSHSLLLIETLSDECIYLHRGKVVKQGNPHEVLKAYEEATVQQAASRNVEKSTTLAERVLGPGELLHVRSVHLRSVHSSEEGYWQCGHPGELTLLMHSLTTLEDISINLLIYDLTHNPGETVQFMMSSRDIGWVRILKGDETIRLTLPQVGLRPGTYRIKLSVSQGELHDILDVVDDVRLVVRDVRRAANCLYYQPRDWSFTSAEVIAPPEQVEDLDVMTDE